jgi:hypothetical protein
MARFDFSGNGHAWASAFQSGGHSLLFESIPPRDSSRPEDAARVGRAKSVPKKVTRKIRRPWDARENL